MIPIICVDDEKIILSSIKVQLKRSFGNRFAYFFADSAEEALELIEELGLERDSHILVVSDWLMPGMKGDELCGKIKEIYRNAITIILTGHADQAAIDNAITKGGLTCCLHKPWGEDELVGLINETCRGI